ncbi:MAG TPA: hypothetical protein VLU46_16455 [Thermoanaerobaculia bacterium]|nr:hypothetical protein [Thermoanaerobaculia bacterium]
MRSGSSLLVTVVSALVFIAAPMRGACINKFTHHDRGPQHTVTLLTGRLSFHDAQALAAAIRDGKAAPIEWVDDKGATIARPFGALKIVRPMPVACEENASGVVMIATFASGRTPAKKILVRFTPKNVVEFDEQGE